MGCSAWIHFPNAFQSTQDKSFTPSAQFNGSLGETVGLFANPTLFLLFCFLRVVGFSFHYLAKLPAETLTNT